MKEELQQFLNNNKIVGLYYNIDKEKKNLNVVFKAYNGEKLSIDMMLYKQMQVDIEQRLLSDFNIVFDEYASNTNNYIILNSICLKRKISQNNEDETLVPIYEINLDKYGKKDEESILNIYLDNFSLSEVSTSNLETNLLVLLKEKITNKLSEYDTCANTHTVLNSKSHQLDLNKGIEGWELDCSDFSVRVNDKFLFNYIAGDPSTIHNFDVKRMSIKKM